VTCAPQAVHETVLPVPTSFDISITFYPKIISLWWFKRPEHSFRRQIKRKKIITIAKTHHLLRLVVPVKIPHESPSCMSRSHLRVKLVAETEIFTT
jgi:hypothetical protein